MAAGARLLLCGGLEGGDGPRALWLAAEPSEQREEERLVVGWPHPVESIRRLAVLEDAQRRVGEDVQVRAELSRLGVSTEERRVLCLRHLGRPQGAHASEGGGGKHGWRRRSKGVEAIKGC